MGTSALLLCASTACATVAGDNTMQRRCCRNTNKGKRVKKVLLRNTNKGKKIRKKM
jgi:hypothetical protein